ncbi:MAG: hypothetical protein JRJ60_16220, partial [Deltaproteobacteria bacterium]|nr:hypothetical protein [Deltaproteobacteria bacterium]
MLRIIYLLVLAGFFLFCRYRLLSGLNRLNCLGRFDRLCRFDCLDRFDHLSRFDCLGRFDRLSRFDCLSRF